MLKFSFPALKEVKISAQQTTDAWWYPDESRVELEFSDFKISVLTDLQVTSKGYLKPWIYSCHMSFGDSYFYHDNQFVAFIMYEVIEFFLVVWENSIYFFGD